MNKISGLNWGDVLFQIVSFLLLAGFIVGVVLIVKMMFGRKKQLDRIEGMLKEKNDNEKK